MIQNNSGLRHLFARTVDELRSVAGQHGGCCLAVGHVMGGPDDEWERAMGHCWFAKTSTGLKR
ncbi:hypothetical protein PQR34_46820 [Paraburkholderia sediminicola]|uniref:hypothetical protein n=1 Tax=Paraburkholderia sediminicola TaxID=458836 RepID=UPI0038BD980D